MEASSNGSEDCSWMYMPACSWMYMQVDGPHSKPMDGDIQCMEGGGDTVSRSWKKCNYKVCLLQLPPLSIVMHGWIHDRGHAP